MANSVFVSGATLLLLCAVAFAAQAPEPSLNSTSTSVTQKLFTYTGSLLPSDWTL